MRRSFKMSSISRNDASSLISGIVVRLETSLTVGAVLAPDLEGDVGEVVGHRSVSRCGGLDRGLQPDRCGHL